MLNVIKTVGSVISTELKDSLNLLPPKQKEMAKKRLSACSTCEYKKETFDKFGDLNIRLETCGICGCILELKSKLYEQDCPHPEGSKWVEKPINTEEKE